MPFVRLTSETEDHNWQVAVASNPHREFTGTDISGDIVMVETDRKDQTMLLILLDVTGHGEVADRLARRITSNLESDSAVWNLPIETLVRKLHSRLGPDFAEYNRSACGMFFQLSHTMTTLVNAGMPHPFRRRNQVWELWSTATWHALGWPMEIELQVIASEHTPKDVYLISSDGVTDAVSWKWVRDSAGPIIQADQCPVISTQALQSPCCGID